ncbi:MAG: PD-(D/E)XK nuclease family protein [Gammaproteobacteria bacterium]|nr:PD-(D/E)XK nuclease family protein [Gammaproteobacteria bacterium]
MANPLNQAALHPAITLIPPGGDPLRVLAGRIIYEHADRLPDLDGITILLPTRAIAADLRRCLLEQATTLGHHALLGPQITTLVDWCSEFIPVDQPVHDQNSKALLLIEALQEHPDLLQGAGPWSIADSLLQLFDELTLHQIDLPVDLADFVEQLARLYQLGDTRLAPFSHEAKLVYTLWQAWHQQLAASGQRDDTTAYLLALSQSLLQPRPAHSLYLAGFEELAPAEVSWIRNLLHTCQAALVLHGLPDQYTALCDSLGESAITVETPETDLNRCLAQIFAVNDLPLAERAAAAAVACPTSPLTTPINIYTARHNEDEANAIDIQVRDWLLAGHRNIGIVTENRRLARRVRALLERANVTLQDASGWALSTTSAAAALEAWLQCVEEDFAWMPFLDLLKSPFIFHDIEQNVLENITYRLEQDIIKGEQTARSLARYRQRFIARQTRLPDWMPDLQETVLPLLDRFEAAAAPLLVLLHKRRFTPHDFLTALHTGLDLLQTTPRLEADAAGMKLLQLLEQMQNSAGHSELQFDWNGARSWLGRQLEQTHFKAVTGSSPVQLMGLGQSRLQRFDALIIAGAEQEYLPGTGAVSPFFNSNVRRELGLPTRDQQQQQRFHAFRRLLEAAPRLLITLRREQDGEPVNPSPWVAQLQSFQQLAWGKPLTAERLQLLADDPAARVLRSDSTALPQATPQPSPSVPGPQLPATITASAYQELLNCPYQFFARRCLELAATEAIREALSKAEYGQLVHRCLQAFHTGINKLPGPFKGTVKESNKQEARQLLEEISRIIFSRDVAENFAHRGWWYLWQSIIPGYIDWQCKRNQEWQVSATEQDFNAEPDPLYKIKGRIDRIDQQQTGSAILDYKTGRIAREDDVKNGEAVQLPFYALLARATHPNLQRIEYLKLDKPDQVRSVAVLEAEELDQLTALTEQRLTRIMQQLHNGRGLPAWPDPDSCEYCDMQTLCRRQVWEGVQ